MVEAAARRTFACTGCGKCCDRGPEIELSEAIRLAGIFVTRAIFKLHSLPLYEHGQRAALWWKRQDTHLSPREALDEVREHLSHFSVRDDIDKARGRSLHLTISALSVDLAAGRCPALVKTRCGIYAERPLTCRTVPLHYSRSPLTIRAYLDAFTATPGYQCATGDDAPPLLENGKVLSETISAARAEAIGLAQVERGWKEEIVRLMDDPAAAELAGLPSYAVVMKNSELGRASLVSMLAPWRVARRMGVLSAEQFTKACRGQHDLIKAALANCADLERFEGLQPLLAGYDQHLAESTLAMKVLNPKTK